MPKIGVQARVDAPLAQKFAQKCQDEGVSQTQVLIRLIEEWVSGPPEVEERTAPTRLREWEEYLKQVREQEPAPSLELQPLPAAPRFSSERERLRKKFSSQRSTSRNVYASPELW